MMRLLIFFLFIDIHVITTTNAFGFAKCESKFDVESLRETFGTIWELVKSNKDKQSSVDLLLKHTDPRIEAVLARFFRQMNTLIDSFAIEDRLDDYPDTIERVYLPNKMFSDQDLREMDSVFFISGLNGNYSESLKEAVRKVVNSGTPIQLVGVESVIEALIKARELMTSESTSSHSRTVFLVNMFVASEFFLKGKLLRSNWLLLLKVKLKCQDWINQDRTNDPQKKAIVEKWLLKKGAPKPSTLPTAHLFEQR